MVDILWGMWRVLGMGSLRDRVWGVGVGLYGVSNRWFWGKSRFRFSGKRRRVDVGCGFLFSFFLFLLIFGFFSIYLLNIY